MTGDVIFEPLPPRESGGGHKPGEAVWVAALRSRPGEWARLPLKVSGISGLRKIYASRRIELTQRTVDGEKRVYGRYVGNPE